LAGPLLRSPMRTTLLLVPALVLGLHSAKAQKALTNQEIWYSPAFGSERVGGLNSMKDGQHYTVLEADDKVPVVNQYAYRTGEKEATIMRGDQLVPAGGKMPVEMDGYSFSGDEKKLMIETASEPIYRYSYAAYNYIFDRGTKTLRPLGDTAKSKQRLATFSPDGARAAFVRDNDLFVVDLATMQERAATTDGEWNKVLNGATDWVYEEEFTLVQGYQWNPAGTKLVYLRSDESRVKEFDLTLFGNDLYPSEYRYKYPKAGEANSRISLHVYDVVSGTTTDVPIGLGLDDFYVPRFGFTDDETVWYMQLNRLQNEKLILTVPVSSLRPVQAGLKPVEIYRETSPTYIEVTDDLHFLKDGSAFILTSEKSGWNHIYWCAMDGRVQRPITAGEFDVTGVQGVDEAGRRVIFTASLKNATQQGVYAIGLNGKGLKELSPVGGYNDAQWSTGFKFFINTRSTANEPEMTTLHEGTGKQVKVLKDNAKLRGKLRDLALPRKEFFTFTTDGGVTMNGWMIKPAGFDSRQQYPVFMTQYSGPNSNEVLDQWDGRGYLWHQLLAQKGYVVVCVDPRGTGRRGRDFRHVTYGQLGKVETEDQIAAAMWLGKQPWVDRARIGIQGWSYGGYMSSLCITKGAGVFKAAIAVAPVTNWRYYDSIYTERYMGLPQSNAKGYDDNSPINHVEKMRGKYLLIHGMADDNVHYQNAAEMTLALIKANKPFDQFAYPDKNHGIYGGNTRWYLYEQMTNWLLENL
jgi:dipeptidyl-peptidase-4